MTAGRDKSKIIMSKITAINIIINKKNQLNRYKELHLPTVGIEDVLMWLNDIQKELEEEQ